MSDREWENMSDAEFETLLEDHVSELPPEDVVAEVTPWKESINRVLVGLALTVITLNFWCLDYILPAVGIVLLLLGFRTLRHENKWFGCCFVMSVIRTSYFFPSLILNTMIIQSSVYASIEPVMTVVNMLLLFLQFVCFWRAFLAVQEKAGVPPHAGAAAALIVWYVLMCLLALVQYRGWIIVGGMIVGYFFIIRNLYLLSGKLDEAGYAIQTASVRIPDDCIVILIVLFLAVGLVCGYLFGGSYPMEWSVLNPAEQGGVEDIKEHLADLGFPTYVLNDLTAEDLAVCEGALKVVVDVTEEPVNDGNRWSDTGNVVYDVKELRITGVGVQVPGEQERWIIFHHFLWTTDPGFYGTESIQLWPVYRDTSEGWHAAGDVTGRVLYDKDGTTFVADYYSLGPQTVTSNSFFWGSQTNTDVFAAFSMPRKGKNYRGYVAYPIDEAQDGYIISSWFNYTHQQSWMQYPAVTAMEKRMTNNWNDAGAFRTIQDALQFYPTDEGVEML